MTQHRNPLDRRWGIWEACPVPALTDSIELAEGRRASYQVIGEGRPIRYFQGGPGFSAGLLLDDARLLADRFALYLIDPHGSGGSTPPSDTSLYDHLGHARFYDEVRRMLGLREVTIRGISFGGIVALTYAALFPTVTARCIAVATRAVGEEIEGNEQADEMQRSLSRSCSREGLGERALADDRREAAPRSVACPTLLLVGELDPLCGPRGS